MRCYICDKLLTEKETVWNKDVGEYEPCTECLEIAYDAAFSDGFSRGDDDDSFVILAEDADEKNGWHDLLYGWSERHDEQGDE